MEMKQIGYAVKSQLWGVERFAYSFVEQAAMAAGLDMTNASTPKMKNGVVRAAREISKDNRRFKNRFCRTVKDDAFTYHVAIVFEEKNADAGTLEYEQNTNIVLDKERSTITVDGPMRDDFYAVYDVVRGAMTQNDIRSFIYKTLRDHGAISIIPTGGLYFVPAHEKGIIDKCQRFLEELNCGRVWAKPEWDDVDSREWVFEAAMQELTGDVDKIIAYVTDNTKKVRESTLNKRKGDLTRKAELVEVYTKLCGMGKEAQNARETIVKALDKVGELLTEL